MKKIIGRQTKFGYIVKLENEDLMTRLSLAKSLQVVAHSPEGFRFDPAEVLYDLDISR